MPVAVSPYPVPDLSGAIPPEFLPTSLEPFHQSLLDAEIVFQSTPDHCIKTGRFSVNIPCASDRICPAG